MLEQSAHGITAEHCAAASLSTETKHAHETKLVWVCDWLFLHPDGRGLKPCIGLHGEHDSRVCRPKWC